MTINEIYQKYEVLENLQVHMLRVAAGVKIISEQIEGFTGSDEAITTALVHDIGNIVKFKLDTNLENYENLIKLQNSFIEKYGSDDHKATIAIMREIGLSERNIEIMEAISMYDAVKTSRSNDLSGKICFYCDKRTVPNGFVSIEERIEDLKQRYPVYKGIKLGSPEYEELIDSVRQIEKQIKSVCKFDPITITKEDVEALVPELRNFEIKI